jgi:four helix bundle protein
MKNPKSEIRSPKEIRNPKSEYPFGKAANREDFGFWSWGEAAADKLMVFREDASSANRLTYDLEERTALFGEAIVEFAKKLKPDPVKSRIITQLVGAATSIGANYCEADGAVSRKEFKLKIGTCRKESKETMFFLRMAAKAEPNLANEARTLWREAKELNLIFGAIWRK